MFYSTEEIVYIFNCDKNWLYYQLRMYRINSFKIGDSWRISEKGVEDIIGLLKKSNELFTDDSRLQGYTERIENIRQKYVQNPARSAFESLQSRRRRMDGEQGRFYRVVGTAARQLNLFDDDDFW
jgi:hypothetical protein